MADSGQLGPELKRYLNRVESLSAEVVGTEFMNLTTKAESISLDHNPEELELLLSRAFDLFVAGYGRFLRDPVEFEQLVEWKHEKTLHGTGRPGVEEALFEEFFVQADLCDSYDRVLSTLIAKNRARRGDQGKAEEYEERLRFLQHFADRVRERAHRVIQPWEDS